ncbi:ankyrin repeat-containing domain, PGG domain protein [Tanacetum coccineum]
MIPPYYRKRKNKDGLTPHELFTKEHKDLVAKGEDWMKGTASQFMVVAELLATIVFAATFTIPGGYNQTNGIPIFKSEATFIVFVVADAISLFSSAASIMIFLSILMSRYAERDFLHSLPRKLMLGLATLFISIETMTIAFSVVYHSNNYKDVARKMTRKPFPHRTERAADLLGLLHTDLCGPLRHVSKIRELVIQRVWVWRRFGYQRGDKEVLEDLVSKCGDEGACKVVGWLLDDMVVRSWRRVVISAKKEAPVNYLTNPSDERSTLRPADVLVFGRVERKHACVDLTGVSPLVGLSSRGFTVGKSRLMQSDKTRETCIENQHVSVPFAFDTFCFLPSEVFIDIHVHLQGCGGRWGVSPSGLVAELVIVSYVEIAGAEKPAEKEYFAIQDLRFEDWKEREGLSNVAEVGFTVWLKHKKINVSNSRVSKLLIVPTDVLRQHEIVTTDVVNVHKYYIDLLEFRSSTGSIGKHWREFVNEAALVKSVKVVAECLAGKIPEVESNKPNTAKFLHLKGREDNARG